MRIYNYDYKKHIGEIVWIYRLYGKTIYPSKAYIDENCNICKVNSKGIIMKTKISNVNNRLRVFTDEQECRDTLQEERPKGY